MPDGGTTVIIQGRSRFQIEAALLQMILISKQELNLWKNRNHQRMKTLMLMLSNIKDLAAEIIQLSPNIPSKHPSF